MHKSGIIEELEFEGMYGMLKIKKIDFIKAVYDESLSHKIFSIANVEFTNAPPINGALLYWRRNTNAKNVVNRQGEFKFFFDEATMEFYASVKFPQHTNLSDGQRRELAFLLLEERGMIGSYSLMGHPKEVAAQIGLRRYNIHKGFEELTFPEQFDGRIEPSHVSVIFDELHLADMHEKNPHLSKEFIRAYIPWRAKTVQQHPEEFAAYLQYIDPRYVLQMNEQLSEFFIIQHLDYFRDAIEQLNYAAHRTMSRFFLRHFHIDYADSAKEVADLRSSRDEENGTIEMPMYDQLSNESPLHQMSELHHTPPVYEHFTFERGRNRWPGSEHLIATIPSFAAMCYSKRGYKKLTNKEMDAFMKTATDEQKRLLSACLELHWLNRYKDELDWSIICAYNLYLRADFLEKHLKYVDFDALRDNLYARIHASFVKKHLQKLVYVDRPTPLLLASLDEELLLHLDGNVLFDDATLQDLSRYTSYIRMKILLYFLGYEHYDAPLYMFYPVQ